MTVGIERCSFRQEASFRGWRNLASKAKYNPLWKESTSELWMQTATAVDRMDNPSLLVSIDMVWVVACDPGPLSRQ